jgi:hypothetical protein
MVSWFKRLFGRGVEEVDDGVVLDEARDAFIDAQEDSPEPWAMFEISGFEDDGRLKVGFSRNQPFIDKIRELGYVAETEDDSVQLFFYTSQMRPTQLSVGDDPVQSAEHPQLSGQQNVLRT